MPVKFHGHLDLDKSLAALHRAAAAFQPQPDPPTLPSNKVGRIAYLPIEISARELPSKAKLAGELARMGWEVIIGASWNLAHNNWADLPPGVILFKTMNYFDGCSMYHAKKNGHAVACLNEELFALKPEREIYEIECHRSARQAVDLACAHGQRQAEIYASLLPSSAVIAVTGNPRTTVSNHVGQDLGAGTPRISESDGNGTLRDENQGDREILVCMMAGNSNGILPVEEYMGVTFRALNRADDLVVAFLEQGIKAEIANHSAILERANDLERRGHRVRIRPHPVENPSLYECTGNCILDDRTPIGERLKDAALCVFVSGCATGVDACLAGVPTERVGAGGHGLSSLEGDSIRAEFSPQDDLADAIGLFQAQRHHQGRMGGARAFELRAKHWQPSQFHRAKFPTGSDIGRMLGETARATEIGWNVWAVTA